MDEMHPCGDWLGKEQRSAPFMSPAPGLPPLLAQTRLLKSPNASAAVFNFSRVSARDSLSYPEALTSRFLLLETK